MILSSAFLTASQGLLSWQAGLSVVVAAVYAGAFAQAARLGLAQAKRWLVAAWVLHAVVLAWGLVGVPARFGFAPALSVTFWLVLLGYYLESLRYTQLPVHWALGAAGAAVVLLASVFAGNALPASTSLWLPLHLTLGVVSYGLFGTAVLHGWWMRRSEKRIRLMPAPHAAAPTGLPLLTLERLTYHFVTAGFVLLTATLLVGLLFGEVVYGHAWRWSHKTIFSLLSWLTFALLLVGRWHYGWRGKRAVQFVYAGSLLLLLSYVGSHFVLEVVLRRAV